jgi:hypothetical protein
MRLVIVSFLALMFGCEATAIAQATKPSDIRVTKRDYPLVGVELPPVTRPPECGVLNRRQSATGPRTRDEVMAERRRMANSWMTAPSRPVNPRSIYCGVIPSASDSTPHGQ